ncbi:hypothetical protein H9623_05975 [Oerskovia sp. Sa1BUA8]|uniref:Uncharacterized protein n=1 Tax=Oerskovia douganii TaxID=2762210 RepID=A0A9D5U7C3_9CELL|nr:hypothetical protein [Oerskovia douganii]MBE7699858.1 hypothetical protein [Oerskovia douganii]
MRPRLVAALVTAVGGLGAACAAPGPDDAPTPTAPLGPAAVYRTVGTGGDAALLEGVVRIVDGCLYVDGQEGTGRYFPYFPVTDTAWEDDTLVWDGGRYVDGDPISLGGGEIGPGGLTDAVAPAGCDDSQGWIVAQRR